MTNSEYMVVLITAKDGEEAGFISKVLLEQKKAACINIIEGINSIYRWNGNIESASENLLIVKTRTALLDEIIRIVKEIHSYDVPEIIALPITGGSFDYLAWVGKETL
ncbi:MAG: divalent-cation tolerance protein CutA [Dehalococcoidales bacterium]|nr:divalent-cation tolerance protein CutA [Dehalococcoidales bacterium]